MSGPARPWLAGRTGPGEFGQGWLGMVGRAGQGWLGMVGRAGQGWLGMVGRAGQAAEFNISRIYCCLFFLEHGSGHLQLQLNKKKFINKGYRLSNFTNIIADNFIWGTCPLPLPFFIVTCRK